MRNLLYFLGSLGLAIAVAFAANHWLGGFDNPGYVLIGIGEWSLETTLIVFVVSLIIGFFVFYFIFRSLGWLLRLPGKIKSRGQNVKFNRSQEALIAGLVDSAEGNFEKAEKILIKHASHSGAPLLHYLTAAKAAQSRGAFDKRDEYLQQAADQSPGSDVAIGLTQAELHLSGKQFDEAVATLTRLHSIDPSHASVLKLMHQAYQQIGDWEGIRKLIPALNNNKVLMEAEVKLLEAEAFSNLLKKTAETQNINDIEALWAEIPNHIKSLPGVAAIYFAAMIDVGADAKIEDELTRALAINWGDTLLMLFGAIKSVDPSRQLEIAEQWLAMHQNSALLLMVLGKLSLKCGDELKATSYLSNSIGVEPTVQAYQLLGEICSKRGDNEKATECYKQGLELASKAVVSGVNYRY
jgi:HemY protein